MPQDGKKSTGEITQQPRIIFKMALSLSRIKTKFQFQEQTHHFLSFKSQTHKKPSKNRRPFCASKHHSTTSHRQIHEMCTFPYSKNQKQMKLSNTIISRKKKCRSQLKSHYSHCIIFKMEISISSQIK